MNNKPVGGRRPEMYSHPNDVVSDQSTVYPTDSQPTTETNTEMEYRVEDGLVFNTRSKLMFQRTDVLSTLVNPEVKVCEITNMT
jgi:hypothetical protein